MLAASETFVNFYQTTQHNNLEDSRLYTHCHENLKSHIQVTGCDYNDTFLKIFFILRLMAMGFNPGTF
jgi:hypothetical protein